MKWSTLFKPVENLEPAAARAFMTARATAGYQLLDVRQPGEYEQGHLAGARLIPVKELPGRLGELEATKPVLVYCAVGGRSRAAAQYLKGQGFGEVYNLSGGIKAWQGRQAVGPEGQGLELLGPETDYVNSLSLGYALEEGLQQFYRQLGERVADAEQKKLLARLAGFEDKHKAWLAEEYALLSRDTGDLPPLGGGAGGLMEGGRGIDDYLARVQPEYLDLEAIIDLAMMFETQAMDLYGRLAQKAPREDVRELFLRLVDEEKLHLGYLESEMDKMLAGGA